MAYKRYDPHNGNGINGENPKDKQPKSNPSRQEMSQDKYGNSDIDHWNKLESLGEISHEDNQRLSYKYKDREHKKQLVKSAKEEVAKQVGIQKETHKNSLRVLKSLAGSKKANSDYSKSFHKYRRDSVFTTNKYKTNKK